MPSTPWTIQRTKRKQTASTSNPRKRLRIFDDVDTKEPSDAKSRDQKTLTQIKWVNSPRTSFEHGLDLQEIVSRKTEAVATSHPQHRKLKKRDSTLTQMDWLGGFHVHQDDATGDATMLREFQEAGASRLPQLDGTNESHIRKQKRKSSVSLNINGNSSPASAERETQDYVPIKRRRKDSGVNMVTPKTGRRRSRRIAAKAFIDTDDEVQPPSHTLPTHEDDPVTAKLNHNPVLEVMDSTEFEHDQTPVQLPQTPRHCREVPSSQTPETVTKTQRLLRSRLENSATKTSVRKPLQEKSVNVPSKSYSQGIVLSKSLINGVKTSPKRSKICVLKVSSRGLLQRSGRVEDSQQDVYSLHATSTPDRKGTYIKHSTKSNQRTTSPSTKAEEPVEIPSTSQRNDSSDASMPSSPPGMITDGSLPELSELIPRRITDPAVMAELSYKQSPHRQADADESVLVHDFGRGHSQKERTEARGPSDGQMNTETSVRDAMLLDEEINQDERAATPIEAIYHDDDDRHSSFGSPIANDTQFNITLVNRTSSPVLPSVVTMFESNNDDTRTDAEADTELPLPVPTLVERPSSSGGEFQFNKEMLRSERTSLPSSESFITTTTVPLNDTMPPPPPLSSPHLPPLRQATQRSVHPASIPRPSQVSTQEPTQNYTFSFIPNPTQHAGEIERITIKDSSSIRLSQIPTYETQSQGLGLQLVEQSDDEIDDLDLDPASSTLHHRHSARKPSALLLRKESSLKTLHPPSNESDKHGNSSIPSSSPLLKAYNSSNGKAKQATTHHSRAIVQPENEMTGQAGKRKVVYDSDATSSPVSSPTPPPSKRKYDPLPGFDNDTQSNFTQDGHITAAYVHRQRETGAWPDWFIPEPFQIPNWKRPAKHDSRRSTKKGKS